MVEWEGEGWGEERGGGAGREGPRGWVEWRAIPELCGEQFSLVTSLDSFLKYKCLAIIFIIFKSLFFTSAYFIWMIFISRDHICSIASFIPSKACAHHTRPVLVFNFIKLIKLRLIYS